MTAEPIAARPKNVALAMSRLATLRSRRLWLVLLFVGFALQVAWRLHLSLPLTGPIAQPDEDGYLLGARVLAGGPEATLPAASIMRPMGYPLLLAPVYLFVQEPVKVYLGVHIVNAVLMAANFPLLYVLGRRLFNTSRVWTAVAAFVLALLPRLVYFGDFALTDVLLPGLLMVLLLAVHEMLTGNRRLVAGVVAGVAAGYAANTHVRGLVMLVALGGLVVVAVWRRWITWSVAAATAPGQQPHLRPVRRPLCRSVVAGRHRESGPRDLATLRRQQARRLGRHEVRLRDRPRLPRGEEPHLGGMGKGAWNPERSVDRTTHPRPARTIPVIVLQRR